MRQILRITSWIFVLMLVFTLVSATIPGIDSRIDLGDVVDEQLIPVTTPSTTLLSDALLAQRTGVVLPPPEPARTNTPLRGKIITPGADEYGFYVLLGDEPENETNTSLNLVFSAPYQPPIVVDETIQVFQNVTITNLENATVNYTLNLWNYAGAVEEQLLKQFESFTAILGNETIGDQSIFSIHLAPLEVIELELVYTYPPIKQSVHCVEQSLADLLPQGATIQYTDLPLDTFLSKRCTVDLTYDQPAILFTPITVAVDDYPQLEGLVGYDAAQQKSVEVKDFQFEVTP